MRFKKIVSKSLVAVLFLNTGITSFAGTLLEGGRYETLEGEYITIEDSEEDIVESIEIFGNTVQDENSLEDIHSVGELYLDENGDPILDSQGREQYKIDIVTTGKNLFNGELTQGFIHADTGEENEINNEFIKTTNFINVMPDKQLFISNSGIKNCGFFMFYDKNKDFISSQYIEYSQNAFTPSNCYYVKLRWHNYGGISPSDVYDVMLSYAEENYEPYKEERLAILSPAPLEKIGNISDRLYWDNSKGRYLIEKNITSITLDGSSDENWVLSRGQHSDVYDHFRVIPHMFGEEEGVSGHGNALLSNRFLCTNRSWEQGPHNSITTSSSQYTQIGMTFDMYYYQTLDGFKDWLKDNPTVVWYQLKTPKIIETDITSKIQILTYDNKTYIYTEAENGVSPTIKITVDRINKLSREAVEKAETEPASTNISLARMWVNQMDESFLKDQLQERLNSISGINDLEIDRKTVTANLDVYIKSDNALSMSLSTNSVTFEGYSGIDDLEKLNAVDVIVSSSLPYDLNAYLEESLQNSDKTSIMSPSTINIRQNGSIDYNQFTNTTDKVILNDNCNVGNNNVHSIDLKLSSDDTHKADVYKAVIKFEAVQK